MPVEKEESGDQQQATMAQPSYEALSFIVAERKREREWEREREREREREINIYRERDRDT
jgi:hypothetical protein